MKQLTEDFGWTNKNVPRSKIGIEIKKLMYSIGNPLIHKDAFPNNNAVKTFICKFYTSVGIDKQNRSPWEDYYSLLNKDRYDFELYLTSYTL